MGIRSPLARQLLSRAPLLLLISLWPSQGPEEEGTSQAAGEQRR